MLGELFLSLLFLMKAYLIIHACKERSKVVERLDFIAVGNKLYAEPLRKLPLYDIYNVLFRKAELLILVIFYELPVEWKERAFLLELTKALPSPVLNDVWWFFVDVR